MALFNIPVLAYSSTPHIPGPATALQPYLINDRLFTIDMVLSILTHNPGHAARRFMAAIVRPTLLFMLDWNRSPDFSINSTFQNVVRDFSVTSRIGELAQAVSFSYWQRNTGFRFVGDFASIANATALAVPPGAKTPDYIMYNPSNGRVALMEAKGTQRADHGKQMARALRQIRDANAYAPADEGWACILTLDQPGGSATLHLRDPASHKKVTESMRHHIFRSSYSAWFDLVGADEMALWCHTPLKKAGKLSKRFCDGLINKKLNLENPLMKVLAESLGFKKERVVFHLNPYILNALRSLSSFKNLKNNLPGFSSAEDSIDEGSELLLPNGTAILPE